MDCRRARQNPGNSNWFGNVNNWVNTMQTSSTSNLYLEKMDDHIEDISLVLKSHILANSQIQGGIFLIFLIIL